MGENGNGSIFILARLSVDDNRTIGHIDLPILLNTSFRIKAEFFRSIKIEAARADFDQQLNFFRCGMTVSVAATRHPSDIGFRTAIGIGYDNRFFDTDGKSSFRLLKTPLIKKVDGVRVLWALRIHVYDPAANQFDLSTESIEVVAFDERFVLFNR